MRGTIPPKGENLTSHAEYADDTTIIPRSSSVIVKRRPAARPGKGKAAYYTAGVGGNLPVSEPNQRGGGGGGGSTWYKGAMSKRFDGKDEGPKANVRHNPLFAERLADILTPSVDPQSRTCHAPLHPRRHGR